MLVKGVLAGFQIRLWQGWVITYHIIPWNVIANEWHGLKWTSAGSDVLPLYGKDMIFAFLVIHYILWSKVYDAAFEKSYFLDILFVIMLTINQINHKRGKLYVMWCEENKWWYFIQYNMVLYITCPQSVYNKESSEREGEIEWKFENKHLSSFKSISFEETQIKKTKQRM